jgi:glycosyltransferase involved in cell wall biosynthesis
MRKKVILRAPVLTRSGYGEQSRFALRSLKSREDLFDIYIQPLEWGKTSWVSEETEERAWIDETIEKTIKHVQGGGTFDVSVQVTIPNEWERIAPHNVGYTAGIETTRVAHQWIMKGNEMDSIIVVSNHSKTTYENTVYDAVDQNTNQRVELKLNKEITSVNYPVKTYENMESLELDLDYDFNFLNVAQMGPRKNLENTIRWFVEEFHDEEVGLVVKTNVSKNCQLDKEITHGNMLRLLKDPKYANRKCKVYLLHGDLTDQEMHEIHLHPNIKASVSFTHGEGFGLPLFESAYMGTPVVATDWSGQLDFLCDEDRDTRFYNVSYDMQPIPESVEWEGVLIRGSMWAYPREASAKLKMRQCYEEVTAGNNTSCEYAAELKERFSEDKMYAAFVDAMNLPATEGASTEMMEFE